MTKCAVIYGIVLDTELDGIFLDFPFLGGVVDSQPQAEALARSITEDRGIPGTVIVRIYSIDDDLGQVRAMALKQFNQTALEIYDVEEQQERRDKRKR